MSAGGPGAFKARLTEELVARLREPGAYALHLDSLICAEVRDLFAPGEFTDRNGKPINAWVVGLATGDAFNADPETLVPLLPEERDFFQALVEQLAAAITGATAAKGAALTPPALVRLVRAAFAQQKRALDAKSEQPRA